MSQQSRPEPRHVAPPPRQPLRSTIPVLLPTWVGPYLDRLAAVFAVPPDALGQPLERPGYDGPVHYKQAQLRAARARGYVPPAPDLPELPSMPDVAPRLGRNSFGAPRGLDRVPPGLEGLMDPGRYQPPTPDDLYQISK